MKRSEIRALIKSAVDELSPQISFNSGRITEFNSEADKQYPYIWLEPLQVSTEVNVNQMPIDSWTCVINVAKQDAIDSLPVQYEAIVDACDFIAQKFVHKLNQVVDGYKLITMTGISREPFVKKIADATSGVIVSFTLEVADLTDVC